MRDGAHIPLGGRVSRLFTKYTELAANSPRGLLAGSLLGVCLLAIGAVRLRVDLDLEKQLPSTHPYVVVDRKIRKDFGGKNFVAIAVLPKSSTVWREDVLRVIHGLTLELLNAPGIIRQNVLSLSSPYVRIVRDRGGALVVDYLMKEVPKDPEGIEELRDLYRSEPLFRGTVVSDDEKAALVLVDFYDDVSEAEIARAVDAAISKSRSDEIGIAVTGAPILSVVENTLVQRQPVYFVGTFAVIVAILYLSFGNIQGVVLPIGTALLSTASALGFMGHVGIPMNPWTAAVPVVVLTVAAGHSAQMLKRYYEEFRRLRNQKEAVIQSTRKIGPVMLAAGATAGSGFATLSVLGIPSLTQFGLGVAAGIFAAVLLEMTFMVTLRVLWPAEYQGGEEGPLSKGLNVVLRPLAELVIARPGRVALLFLVLLLTSLLPIPKLRTDVDVYSYWPETSEIGRTLRIFEEHFPGTTPITILIEGKPGSMKTSEALVLMRRIQDAMAQDPGIVRTSSLADVVERIHKIFAPEEADGLPRDQDVVSQLLYLADSPALEHYIDRSYQRSVVFGFFRRNDSAVTRRVIGRIEEVLSRYATDGFRVSVAGGVAAITLALNEHTIAGKWLNIAVVLAAILGIASILLRSISGGAYVVAPLVMVLVVTLGLFAAFGIAFDLAGASIAAMGVGIGADYAIYFLCRLREETEESPVLEAAIRRAMETSGRAILFVALAIAAGFGVYLSAGYRPLKLCGLFMPITMLVSSLTALVLLPALAMLFRPRFAFRREYRIDEPAGDVAPEPQGSPLGGER